MTPYTDADVDLVADAIVDARLQGHRDWTGRIARAVLDALTAAGRLPAVHHQRLLDLTAAEIDALRVAALSSALDHGSDDVLRSALDKLTTAEAQP